MSVIAILAAVIMLLAVISLFPQTNHYPALAVGLLLAGVCLFLVGKT